MAKFRKKPVVIEAVQFLGLVDGGACLNAWPPDWPVGRWSAALNGDRMANGLIIPTLEGDHRADAGDWIIKGVKGEFYPCKPDIFAASYEPAPEHPCTRCGAPTTLRKVNDGCELHFRSCAVCHTDVQIPVEG